MYYVSKLAIRKLKNNSSALLLDVVGYVKLRFLFWCMTQAEIADGKIGQTWHTAYHIRPVLYGIGIRDDDDIPTTQWFQIPAL